MNLQNRRNVPHNLRSCWYRSVSAIDTAG